jgi:protein-disulfide isomerase
MELRPDEAPSIGPRDATRAVVFLFDYTCPHCRDVHARLRTAQERLDRRFSVICLPVPLDGSCNPLIRTTLPQHRQACDYARLGLAVWRCDRDAFPQFDSWMAQEVRLPDLEGAKAHAGQLVGPERLSKAMSDDWIEEMLRKDVRIYQEDSLRAGSAVLPQIVAGNVISVGPILLEDLVDLLRTNLALDQDGSSR